MNNSVISQRIQDSFLFLAITDTKFLQVSRNSVKPEYFSSQVTEDIVQLCYSYFDQFKEAPVNHLHDEVIRFLRGRDVEEKERYYNYLKGIHEMSPPNESYVIARINDFVKAREFETAAIEFVQLTEKGDFTTAKQLMQKALKVGIEREEVGLKYFDSEKPSYYGLGQDLDEYLIPTGFDVIDRRLKGLRRKQFLCILGGYKGKKTWLCHYLGKQGVMGGKKVLHITHENSLEETEKRYDMMFGGLISSLTEENIQFERINEDGVTVERWESVVDTVFNLSEVMTVRRKMKKFGGELIIRKYPMGVCTMEEIDRYLDYLETYEQFIPDILINDYVEIMDLPLGKSSALRDRINQAYIEHKRIADERNILVVTVSQAVRSALQSSKLSQKDFAEDIRKLGNTDIVFALTQTEAEGRENRMGLYVLANRTGVQDFGCKFSINLTIGQFCTNCWEWTTNVEVRNDVV